MPKKSNGALQITNKPGKSHLPSPFLAHRIVLKEGIMRQIMAIKGWRTYEDAGNALGFTRQYMQMVDKTRIQVGPEFITRLAACLGNLEKNWWGPFDIIPWGVFDKNHPQWNQNKHNGQSKYSRHSLAAGARSRDYKVETEEKWNGQENT